MTEKQDFFESEHCKSRVHCKACRGDREFRESLAGTFDLPSVDFECPIGIVEEDFEDGRMPSVVQQAKNAAMDAKKIVASGVKRADAETVKKRMAHCTGGGVRKPCDFYTEDGKCRKCSCVMKWKVAWAATRCPIGRW